jgi:hypothetical protein
MLSYVQPPSHEFQLKPLISIPPSSVVPAAARRQRSSRSSRSSRLVDRRIGKFCVDHDDFTIPGSVTRKMSADLFAEFGDFSQSTTPQHQFQGQQGQAQPAASTADPFAFLGTSTTYSAQPQLQASTQPWPALQTPLISTKGKTWAELTGLENNAQQAEGDEDDTWGDFEVASPAAATGTETSKGTEPASAAIPSADSVPKRTRIVRASTLDLMTNNLLDFGSTHGAQLASLQELSPPPTATKPPPRPKNEDPNVLFDADDFDPDEVVPDSEDDDFGDFETVSSTPAPQPRAPVSKPAQSLDIFSTNWSSAPAPEKKQPPSQLLAGLSLSDISSYPQPPKSPSFQERNPFPGLAVTTPVATEFPAEIKADAATPVTVWPTQPSVAAETFTSEDNWAGFDAAPVDNKVVPSSEANLGWEWDTVDAVAPQPAVKTSPARRTAVLAPIEPASDWDWGDDDDIAAPPVMSSTSIHKPAAKHSIPDNAPPPVNIPPPSILLSILPQLLELPNATLFRPATGQPASVRSAVYSAPETASFLRGYLALATVAARLLAGRKMRWQRDRHLAQGMAVSAAGGQRGMKLTGIDRTESAREDREAADVLAAWKSGVGKLRSAVAAVNSAQPAAGNPGTLKVPGLETTMAISTAKVVPTAPKACVVCGLKRDERVKGVDFDVEDSFGEWWVEHWGHRACRNFWVEHEGSLRSR